MTTIKAGQIWREVDPRKVRHIRVVEEPHSSSPAAVVRIETVFKMGDGSKENPHRWDPQLHRTHRTGITRAMQERFNGKRGGYELFEDVP